MAWFAFQSAAVVAWWAALSVRPDWGRFFVPEGWPTVALETFLLPDLVLAGGGSVVAAFAAARRSRSAMIPAWIVAGGMGYAALHCVGWLALTGSGALSVAAMAPAAVASVVAALDLSPGIARPFRRARPATPTRHLVATTVQIVFFWGLFLGLVPFCLVGLERLLGVPGFGASGSRIVGAGLFALCSSLGLASGVVMARRGEGTPLPIDATRRLVDSGPYAVIRNPMVVAGIGQGLGLAGILGSWSVAAYAVLGASVWQVVVRPAEEADLVETFGAEYEDYRRRVPCWMPRRRPR